MGIDRVAVVAMSHGGPSALLFEVMHQEGVSSLTIVSAGVASSAAENHEAANRKGDMLVAIYRIDALYFGMTRLFKKALLRLMGANDAVIAGLTPAQRDLVMRLVGYMNTATPRAAGTAFDNNAAMPNERIASIAAPTLVIHAQDDALQLFYNAEFAATRISGARLFRFERGGHHLAVVDQEAVRAAIRRHILDHSGGLSTF